MERRKRAVSLFSLSPTQPIEIKMKQCDWLAVQLRAYKVQSTQSSFECHFRDHKSLSGRYVKLWLNSWFDCSFPLQTCKDHNCFYHCCNCKWSPYEAVTKWVHLYINLQITQKKTMNFSTCRWVDVSWVLISLLTGWDLLGYHMAEVRHQIKAVMHWLGLS